MIAILTAPKTFGPSAKTYRYKAQLVSKRLDFEGVPVAHQTIDLLVNAPTEEAIALAIAGTDWLKGYSLMSYWLPEDGCSEF